MSEQDFDALVGKIMDFRGVDSNCLSLDGVVWEAIEDEDDGYRSSLSVVRQRVRGAPLVFQLFAFAQVRVEKVEQKKDYDFEGYHIVDVVDGHRWLRIGTDHSDSYYPWFVFDYTPKAIIQPRGPIMTKFGYLASDSIN